MYARQFEELDVWRNARTLCTAIIAVSQRGRFRADDVLRKQIYRAALSIVSNIAEGFESRTIGLNREFLGRAKGSAGEVRAQLHIARDLGYLDDSVYAELLAKVRHCSAQLQRYMARLH
ncbi:MAG: four helix bundle protein [Ignavibacteriae bacterium]|nr:four helix bundle protein [Ignavibacteriota bacterium]